MPSDFATEFSEQAVPDLFDQFGEPVTHKPNGTGSGTSVNAIVSFDDPVIDTEGGQRERQSGVVKVDDSVTITNKDTWVIDGITYQTTRTMPAVDGMKRAFIQAMDFEYRTHGSGSKL